MAKSKPSRSRFPLAQDRPNKPAVKKTISRDVTCKAEQTRSKLYVLFVEREKHERLHRRNAFPSNPLAKSPPTITKNENPDDDHNSISRGTRQKSRRYIPKGSERGRYFRESPRGHPSPVGNFAGGTSANGRDRLSSNPSSIVHLLQGDHNDQIGDFCGIGGNAGISTPSSNRIGDRKCLGPCKYSINVVNTSCIRCGAPRLNAMSSNPPTSHETLKPEWTEIETPAFHTTFIDSNAHDTEPLVPASNLIPVSLPDSSFWPTPALGHHSQEYAYSTSDAIAHQGLGIIKPFPSDFPQPHPFKSAKPTHAFSRSPVPYLVYPVNIAHKEWLRQNPSPLPRKVERDRCDPQAEEEDAFVEKLRDQNTPWNLVRQQFSKKFNKELPEARLSMRLLRRRKERLARREDKVAKDLVKTQVR